MTRKDQRHTLALELLRRLQAAHQVLKHFRPLAEDHVEQQLVAAHPEEEPWLVRLALHLHLTSDNYLQSLAHGGARFDLAGDDEGQVTPHTRHHARSLLKHHRSLRGRGKPGASGSKSADRR